MLFILNFIYFEFYLLWILFIYFLLFNIDCGGTVKAEGGSNLHCWGISNSMWCRLLPWWLLSLEVDRKVKDSDLVRVGGVIGRGEVALGTMSLWLRVDGVIKWGIMSSLLWESVVK